MMKFFRKHNKKLLAIFMALLMIVFVGGSALNSLLTTRQDPVVAESTLGPISYSDQRIALGTTRVLESLGHSWQWPVGSVGSEPLQRIDWVLLSREAELLGTRPSMGSIKGLFAEPSLQDRIKQVAYVLGIKPERIYIALTELQAIQKAALTVAGASTPSEAEIRKAALDALDKVKINAVSLPAASFVNEGLPFSESELLDHYRAHAEKEAGEGLNFGYYVPPLVQIQCLKVESKAIMEVASVPDFERKAREYYEQNREVDFAFQKPAEADPYDESADEEFVGPPTPPEYLVESSPYLDWEEAKEIAYEGVRTEHARKAAAAMADWILQYTGELWAGAARDPESRYKIAPAESAELDRYQAIVERIPANIAYPQAASVTTTEFFTAKEAVELPGIGSASFSPPGGQSVRLSDVAFLNQALVPAIPIGNNARFNDYLALYQTSQYPLTDSEGSVYLFRVVAGREAHKPESLDEVRDQVIADLRLRRGYEAALSRAELMQFNAVAAGLKNVYDEDVELVEMAEADKALEEVVGHLAPKKKGLGYSSPSPFARVMEFLAAYGRSEGGTVVPGGLGNISRLRNDVVDQCFALEEADEPVAIIELPDEATVLVVEWVETRRGTDEDFERIRERLVQGMIRHRSSTVLSEWLDPEKIRARNSFVATER